MRTINVIEGIFFAALEKVTPGERVEYLDEACKGDAELRRAVERMLAAHPKVGAFMESPAAGLPVTTDHGPLSEKPGSVIGPYKLLQELGEGGFGVVFMAEQTEPVRRKVALKVIKPGMDSKQVVARFEQERQALAMMDHPHIARVFDGGTTESGRPYFVMELVKGIPITRFCDDNRLNPRERLELFAQVCSAIQHAHQKGIIHRDIKPSNVLVTMYDDKPVVKVIDFGVAKAIEQKLTEGTLFTRVGQVIGTLEYMSPEQASLNALDVDTRSDVYALGVLLYELLTGSTPLDKEKLRSAGFAEMLRLIREEEPQRPSDRISGSGVTLPALAAYRKTQSEKLPALVRGELDWITLKALDKDRSRRYQSALGMAEDVARYLRDEPVLACPPSLGYRAGKFLRKHKAAFTLAGTAATLLLFGALVSGWLAVRALNAERVALVERDDAETARVAESEQRQIAEKRGKDLRRREYLLAMNLVQAAWHADDTKRMVELLDKQRPQPGEEDLRGFEWHFWDRQLHQELGSGALREQATSYVLSGDGSRAAFARYSDTGTVRLLEVVETKTGKVLFSQSEEPSKRGAVRSLSRDGRRLLIHRDADAQVPGKRREAIYEVWDVATGKKLFARQSSLGELTAYDADLRQLAVTDTREFGAKQKEPSPLCVKVYDLNAPEKEPVLLTSKATDLIQRMTFSPDGSRLAAVSPISSMELVAPFDQRNLVHVWDTEGELLVLSHVKHRLNEVVFSPDNKRLGGIGEETFSESPTNVFLWDCTRGKDLKELWGRSFHSVGRGRGGALRFSPDSRWLAVTRTQVPVVHLLDTVSGGEVQVIKSPLEPVRMAFDKEGKRLITLAFPTGRARASLSGRSLSWQEWDVTDGASRSAPLPRRRTEYVAWSSDGERQAVCVRTFEDNDRRPQPMISIRDRHGKEIHAFDGHSESSSGFIQFRFSPNGRFVWSGTPDTPALIWETDTGKVVWKSRQPKKGGGPSLTFGTVLSFSPDGRFVVREGDKAATVVRFDDLRELFEVGNASGAYFSPDSTRLVTMHPSAKLDKEKGSTRTNNEGKLWDVQSGQVIHGLSNAELPRNSLVVTPVMFSPDSRLFLVKNESWEVRDSASGELRFTLSSTKGAENLGVAFSKDGTRLITGGNIGPGTLGSPIPTIVWDLTTGKELFRLEGFAWLQIGDYSLTFNRTGDRIAAISNWRSALGRGPLRPVELKVWDGVTGHELLRADITRSIPPSFLGSSQLSFSDDGHRLHLGQPEPWRGLRSMPTGVTGAVIDGTPREESKR